MAEPVDIDLSWDIVVRFGDLRKDVIFQKQLSLPIIRLCVSVCSCYTVLYVVFLFYALQMLVRLLFMSLSYHVPIFLAFHCPSCITPFSTHLFFLFFYLPVLFTPSYIVSYFSCLLPHPPFLILFSHSALSVFQPKPWQSSILIFSPSFVYLCHVYFQTPCLFLHSVPLLRFSLSYCLQGIGKPTSLALGNS